MPCASQCFLGGPCAAWARRTFLLGNSRSRQCIYIRRPRLPSACWSKADHLLFVCTFTLLTFLSPFMFHLSAFTLFTPLISDLFHNSSSFTPFTLHLFYFFHLSFSFTPFTISGLGNFVLSFRCAKSGLGISLFTRVTFYLSPFTLFTFHLSFFSPFTFHPFTFFIFHPLHPFHLVLRRSLWFK